MTTHFDRDNIVHISMIGKPQQKYKATRIVFSLLI